MRYTIGIINANTMLPRLPAPRLRLLLTSAIRRENTADTRVNTNRPASILATVLTRPRRGGISYIL
ncbi:MAG: hypothetical protein J7J82_03335 [Staphylothermus sp.]|nr:hypothetical protein [Staphylothermus sp.]